MKFNINEHKKTITAVTILAFAVTFLISILNIKNGIYDNFASSDGFINVNSQQSISVLTIIISFLFLLCLVGLLVVSYIIKSKTLIIISLSYYLLLIIAVFLLGIVALSTIADMSILNIIVWFTLIMLSPIFGVIWTIGPVFFALIFVLLVLNIVFTVKIFKRK